MNTNTRSSKGPWIPLNERRAARAGILLLLLLLLTLPGVVQAQFTYADNGDGTAAITGYNGPGGDVNIPSTINGLSVTSVGGYYDTSSMHEYWGAFQGNQSVTSVTIPDSVTSIGPAAFAFCSSLTSIVVPDSVTTIGDRAFPDCGSLTNVIIGNRVTYIGYAAFWGCPLTSITIPNSVTSIGREAFEYCGLTSVTIGSGLSSIGNDVFLDCRSLMLFNVDAANAFYSSVAGVLFNKSQTVLMQYPGGKAGGYTLPNSVTNIGRYAFYDCAHLTDVTIPNSVVGIGDWAFEACVSLTNLTIGNSVTSIGSYAFYWCTSLTDFTIPNSVTSIGYQAFGSCFGLSSITIPDSVTTLGSYAFQICNNLTNLTIGNSVTNIGSYAFEGCHSLTCVTIGNGVTSIGDGAFDVCPSLGSLVIPRCVASLGNAAFASCTWLAGVYFQGNAPSVALNTFQGDTNTTVYYLPGTTGWGATYGGRPTALWIQVPAIQSPPQTQTAEAGSALGLRVKASSPLPLVYFWYLNATNLLSSGTNWQLDLPNVQLSQSGAYTVVISNVLGAITSAPAMLNVIAPVERRPVPGVKVTSEAASLVNVDYADSLSPAPTWTPLSSVTLTNTSQYCCDPTLPLAPQRFYRAWQTGTPGVRPSLDLHPVPAIMLTGTIGHSVRVDYINQFGPIDAWVTLATVPMTNTSQLYFDISAPGQPQRLYRLVPSP